MPSIMERVFGTPKPKQEPMQVQNPGADPKAINQQPNGQSANGPAEPVLPLDQFKDIWNTAPTDPSKAPVDPFSQPLITADPTKINEAVSKMDFAGSIAPELVTKALGGDVTSFNQVLNTAVQKALAAQITLSSQMVEGAVRTNNERHAATLPKRIREAQTNDIRSQNPVLNHEAAAPMLDMAKRSIMAKHPDKSPQEIHQMAEDMLTTFASTLVETNTKSKQPQTRDPEDFSNFL